MPRFVVLTHDHPFLHWDFMLEEDTSLRTWRLMQPPDFGESIDAETLADHRLDYLNYEGPVSGGRGEVKRWDCGEYETIESTPMRVAVRLAGERLRGTAFLEPAASGPLWIFRFIPQSI